MFEIYLEKKILLTYNTKLHFLSMMIFISKQTHNKLIDSIEILTFLYFFFFFLMVSGFR